MNPNAVLPLVKNSGFWRAFGMTAIVSSVCALLCVAASCAFCAFITLSNVRKKNAALLTLPVLPLAVSSIVLGLGAAILIKRGNVALYVLARASLSWTLAFKQMSPYFARVREDVKNAALALSPSKTYAVFAVLLPYARRGIASAFAFCFASCAADASLPLMLALSRFDTLALYTYRLAGSYKLDQACAAGIALIALSAVVFALADRFAGQKIHTGNLT
jgi:thiamine transport system permease protein